MNKLFVYGIFLSERQREHYGMSNSRYATVLDYVTIAIDADGHIVQAVPLEEAVLTGLVVDVPSYINEGRKARDIWSELDRLEHGYERVKITTTDGERTYMYVAPKEKGVI